MYAFIDGECWDDVNGQTCLILLSVKVSLCDQEDIFHYMMLCR